MPTDRHSTSDLTRVADTTPDRDRPARRLDLQGVRALAILLVVGFHSGVPGFDSGYVGVDVFFVLSGYLIAGISSRALRDQSSGGIPRLIVKRLGRLIPAAAVLMALLGAVALALFGAQDRVRLGGETVSASLAQMNVFLQRQQTDYLRQSYDSGLLEHFWSLSLEWQFYGAALLVVAAAYLTLRLRGVRSSRGLVLTVLVAGTAVSLLISITLSPTEPAAAYLAFSTRVWEFGIGAALWFAIDRAGPITGRASVIGSALGLLLVLFAGASFGTEQPYPGALALIPVLGTVLLIAFTGNALANALAQPWLQFLGDRSYSWYLWHWPLLVLFAMYFEQPSWPIALAICTVALGIAHVSYELVENPSRRWAARARVVPAAGLFALCVVLTVAVGIALERSGEQQIQIEIADAALIASQTGVLPAADPIQADASIPRIYHEGCHADFTQVTPNACVYGNPSGTRIVFLWGDSQAAQWFPALEAAAKLRGWRLLTRTKSSCPPILRGDIWLADDKREYRECLTWNRRVQAEILDAPKGSVVLLGAYGSYRVTDGAATPLSLRESGPPLRQTAANGLEEMTDTGVRASFFEEIFASPRPAPSCIARLGAENCSFVPQSDPVDLLLGLPTTEPMIETRRLQCPATPCPVVRDGVITMRDDIHLTAAFAATYSEPIMLAIDQMLN